MSNNVQARRLEFEERELGMTQRLLRAAERIRQSQIAVGKIDGHAHTLRGDQIGVFASFVEYIVEVTGASPDAVALLVMARIILPPRTGKTVLAAAAIAGTGLMCTFIVPKKALVTQTANELRAQLPGVPVGEYFSDVKNPVWFGVNVTTYSMLQSEWRTNGCLPAFIALSSLVFTDEAHHSMTPATLEVLSKGFDPLALRVALTATPNYSEKRQLAMYFPYLIYEITLIEAVQLAIIAHLNVHVEEVDVDGSVVEVKKGDLDDATLGRIMALTPLFHKGMLFRYQAKHRRQGALICCSTQQQARDLYAYLCEHRPKSHPKPELILDDTKSDERNRIINGFDAGLCDTIINVGVLIEGWNSKRCKVLVDYAITLSTLRATQKYFRPLTKDGDEEATIYILKPKNLARQPILPMDLLGSGPGLTILNLPTITPKKPVVGTKTKRLKAGPKEVSEVKTVKSKSKTVYKGKFRPPTLDRQKTDEVRAVFLSHPGFKEEALPLYRILRTMIFDHPKYTGRGQNLLHYLGSRGGKEGYIALMLHYFPEGVGELQVRELVGEEAPGSCDEDALHMESLLLVGGSRDEDFATGWLALGGPHVRDAEPLADEQLETNEVARWIEAQVTGEGWLQSREARVLHKYYGFPASMSKPPSEEMSFSQIAREFYLTPGRIGQIHGQAIRKLRYALDSPFGA